MAVGAALVPAILEFWFGSSDPAARVEPRAALWFGGGADYDEEIRRRYAPTHAALARGEGRAWLATPGGRLATILVLDQFSRNLYRDDPMAFAFDPIALQLALEGVDQGVDAGMGLHQRAFFYLPLEHSEDRGVQARSVALYTALRDAAPPEDRAAAEMYLDYAQRHKDIVDRFGRYPHRNAALGRTTTIEEFAFLRKPGSRF